jgi:hypothetical protein
MTGALAAIDCDVHPTVPDMTALLPYLGDFWRATVVERGINSLETVTYPPNAPLTARPQWRGRNGRAATRRADGTCLRPLAGGGCDLELPLWGGPPLQRGHGLCLHARA